MLSLDQDVNRSGDGHAVVRLHARRATLPDRALRRAVREIAGRVSGFDVDRIGAIRKDDVVAGRRAGPLKRLERRTFLCFGLNQVETVCLVGRVDTYLRLL